MNLKAELEQLGLSEKEAKVYLATLELSKETVQRIAKKAGVNRPTGYVILASLADKGLCSTFQKKGKTYYVAENPENLSLLLATKKQEIEERQKHLGKLMDELKAIYNLQEQKPFVRFFEGKKGLLATRNETVAKEGDTIRGLYPLEGVEELYTDAERKESHAQRNERKIHARILYTSKGKAIASDASRDMLKIESDKFPFAADISLYDEKVRITSLNEKMAGIIVDDPEIYKTFVSLFELAWIGAQHVDKNEGK